jgi:hypothetical protein
MDRNLIGLSFRVFLGHPALGSHDLRRNLASLSKNYSGILDEDAEDSVVTRHASP